MTRVVRDGRQRAAALRTVPIGLVILLISAGAAFGETYHVDCAAGSDAAARAIQLERQGKSGEALKVWRNEVFGPLFPLS